MENKLKSAFVVAKQIAEAEKASRKARQLAKLALRGKFAARHSVAVGGMKVRAVTKGKMEGPFVGSRKDHFLDLIGQMYGPVESRETRFPLNGVAGLSSDFAKVDYSINNAMQRLDDQRAGKPRKIGRAGTAEGR